MLDGASATVKTVNMVEIKPKPKCCRNLFGAPSDKDREHMTKMFEDSMKEEVRIAKDKWEFDILRDIPLSERWELTTSAPDFYTRGYVSKGERINPLKRKLDFTETESHSEIENNKTCNRPMKQLQLTCKYTGLVQFLY
jgi:hypothetical protein